MTLTEASVSSEEFTISGAQFPLSLQAGQKANFTVWFNGSKAGKASGTLNFSAAMMVRPIPSWYRYSRQHRYTAADRFGDTHNFGNVTVNTTAKPAL